MEKGGAPQSCGGMASQFSQPELVSRWKSGLLLPEPSPSGLNSPPRAAPESRSMPIAVAAAMRRIEVWAVTCRAPAPKGVNKALQFMVKEVFRAAGNGPLPQAGEGEETSGRDDLEDGTLGVDDADLEGRRHVGALHPPGGIAQ